MYECVRMLIGKKEVQTSADQDLAEYKENQDITAPPDPIAEGTTSDVPIRGEKTNVLFHPTPTVSYQPMFEVLHKRAAGLCIGIPAAIIVIGRIFGGSFWGLIPLAFCISSGVWLWMQEVIRSGREMEWSSEQLRGQMVSIFSIIGFTAKLTISRPRPICSQSLSNG